MDAPASAPEIRIAPSLLSCDFARLADEVRRAEDAGADWLHVDVMDGHFVPNLTIGPPVVAAIGRVAGVPLDVHLMIAEPARYAADFVAAGAHVLTFHAEVAGDAEGARALARAFRAAGAPRVGMALNPETAIEPFADALADLDLVLVMSVHPGFGGQSFIPDVLAKTRWLRAQGFCGDVEMDGGLNAETIPDCAAAGANALVSGSALFGAPDMGAELSRFRAAALAARGQEAMPRREAAAADAEVPTATDEIHVSEKKRKPDPTPDETPDEKAERKAARKAEKKAEKKAAGEPAEPQPQDPRAAGAVGAAEPEAAAEEASEPRRSRLRWKKKDMPGGLWLKCESCSQTIYRKELEEKGSVCPACGFHFTVPGRRRVQMVLDEGSFEERFADLATMDRLEFTDKIPYGQKVQQTVERTGQTEALICGTGTIEGRPVVLAVLDFSFMGGSMGEVVGEKVALAAEMALVQRRPLLVFTSSGGARMHEGMLSLLQMAKTCSALDELNQRGGFSICVMTNPTTGGVTASFASVCDVTLAEPGALIGFAGPRVIATTLKQELPPGFQRAEFLLEKGQIDAIVSRAELRSTLARLIDYGERAWR